MAYLSDASVRSSSAPPTAVSSNQPGQLLGPPRPSPHFIARGNPNPDLNAALAVPVAVSRPQDRSLALGAAHWIVLLLTRAGWPAHVAKRVVAALCMGQQ